MNLVKRAKNGFQRNRDHKIRTAAEVLAELYDEVMKDRDDLMSAKEALARAPLAVLEASCTPAPSKKDAVAAAKKVVERAENKLMASEIRLKDAERLARRTSPEHFSWL